MVFKKRIKKNTGKFPLEISNEPLIIDGFTICNFINPDFTLYDAIQIIKFDDVAIIHANDNWHKYPDNLISEMNEFLDGIEHDKIYYFVQYGIADSFPMNYPQYSQEEIEALILDRFTSYKEQTEQNLKNLNCENGFYYANQSTYPYCREIPLRRPIIGLKIFKRFFKFYAMCS